MICYIFLLCYLELKLEYKISSLLKNNKNVFYLELKSVYSFDDILNNNKYMFIWRQK